MALGETTLQMKFPHKTASTELNERAIIAPKRTITLLFDEAANEQIAIWVLSASSARKTEKNTVKKVFILSSL